jgi:antitoxin MazE
MRATIQKWGNSLAVRIPKPVALEVGFRSNTAVELTIRDGGLVLLPAQPEYSLEDLVKGITPRNRHGETDFGPQVGREVL